jgi:hypothetical protein
VQIFGSRLSVATRFRVLFVKLLSPPSPADPAAVGSLSRATSSSPVSTHLPASMLAPGPSAATRTCRGGRRRGMVCAWTGRALAVVRRGGRSRACRRRSGEGGACAGHLPAAATGRRGGGCESAGIHGSEHSSLAIQSNTNVMGTGMDS